MSEDSKLSENQSIYNINFVLALFSIFPIVDTLTGYFASVEINFPIGVLYRIFFIVIMIMINLKYGLKFDNLFLITCFGFIILVLLIQLQSILLERPLGDTFQEYTSLLKFYLWLIILNFINQMRSIITEHMLNDTFIKTSIYFVICYLLPKILNMGEYSYEDSSAGYKAFFFGVNDATYLLIVLSTFLCAYIIKNKNLSSFKRFFLVLLFFTEILSFLIMGTKSALFYGIALTVYFVFRFFKDKNNINLVEKIVMFVFLLIVLIGLIIFGSHFISVAWSGAFNRLKYFYLLYSGDFFRFITSSRSTYLVLGIKQLLSFNESTVILFLIGFGYDYRWTLFNRAGGLIEMDIFDIIFSYGSIGFLIWLVFIMYIVKTIIKYKKRNVYSFLFVVSIVYGFWAGHVFYSALSTSIFGLICGGIILIDREEEI